MRRVLFLTNAHLQLSDGTGCEGKDGETAQVEDELAAMLVDGHLAVAVDGAGDKPTRHK